MTEGNIFEEEVTVFWHDILLLVRLLDRLNLVH
jgi:hypothetical protein